MHLSDTKLFDTQKLLDRNKIKSITVYKKNYKKLPTSLSEKYNSHSN